MGSSRALSARVGVALGCVSRAVAALPAFAFQDSAACPAANNRAARRASRAHSRASSAGDAGRARHTGAASAKQAMTSGFEDGEDGVAALPYGGRLAYEIHGRAHAGTPLLLIRPLGGSMALWGVFRARLAQRLRVVSFDLRGTGHSSADPAWVSS